MIFAVASMSKNNHSLYDCFEYGIRAAKHQRCGISRPRYMSTWIGLSTGQTTYTVEPHGKSANPRRFICHATSAVESLSPWRELIWTLKAARDPSKPSQRESLLSEMADTKCFHLLVAKLIIMRQYCFCN